jgi:hypothetical protein
MNNEPTFRSQYQSQLAQDRFGLNVTARLSDASGNLPHDISERLRAARVQAVAQRKVESLRTASSLVASAGGATLTYGEEKFSLWEKIASAVPVILLLAGLVAVTVLQNDNRARELADIDAALLIDDLPPSAYADPGFVQFLKAKPGQNQ